MIDPRDIPGTTAFAEDREADAWDQYLEALAADEELRDRDEEAYNQRLMDGGDL